MEGQKPTQAEIEAVRKGKKIIVKQEQIIKK